MKKLLLRIAIYLLVSTGFCAEIYVQDILYDYNEIQLVILEQAKTVVTMAAKKSIVHAVEKHNSLGLVMDEILRRDKRWMSSHNTEEFKIKLQENISGVILKSMVLRNRAMYSEAFLTGNKGANVGAYPATSDYWQGDEDKFKIAFNKGNGRLLITPVEFDNSSGTYAAQVAAPVVNNDGVTIGVLFVGIKLSYAKVK
ncbi:hypothetical protein A9Q81_14985 [Gammaproteobacteria bacterium 42_54_T18]|nr:hypothetical protein A9Q81_14985 [Gammaproteobacteria bacterium 42_54_T18]